MLRAVLSSPQHSPLHDEALAVVALHCAPDADVPRSESLALLYHVLGINPTYRQVNYQTLRCMYQKHSLLCQSAFTCSRELSGKRATIWPLRGVKQLFKQEQSFSAVDVVATPACAVCLQRDMLSGKARLVQAVGPAAAGRVMLGSP